VLDCLTRTDKIPTFMDDWKTSSLIFKHEQSRTALFTDPVLAI